MRKLTGEAKASRAVLAESVKELFNALQELLDVQPLAAMIDEHDNEILGSGHDVESCALCMAREAMDKALTIV